MSGKPQYDEADVLDAAMAVFWTHGYAAASVSDLIAATGLSRSSLYQRFGDKDGLFKEVLERYRDRVVRRMKGAEGNSQKLRIEALLRDFVPRPGKSARPAGCLLARCCAEMADIPATAKSSVVGGVSDQHAAIEGILRAASASGELPAGTDLSGMAWYYLGVAQAIVNLPQAGAPIAAMRRMVDVAMSAWPPNGSG